MGIEILSLLVFGRVIFQRLVECRDQAADISAMFQRLDILFTQFPFVVVTHFLFTNFKNGQNILKCIHCH